MTTYWDAYHAPRLGRSIVTVQLSISEGGKGGISLLHNTRLGMSGESHEHDPALQHHVGLSPDSVRKADVA